MFVRMMLRSALRDRSRSLLATSAVVVAATVATALLNLYADLDTKMHREFRGYGANVVMTSDYPFPPETIARVEQLAPGGSRTAPFVYSVAKTANGSPVVIVATNFQRVRQLNSWWNVSQWPQASGEALFGLRAEKQLAPDGKPIALAYGGKSFSVTPSGRLQTGGDEDSRIYVSIADFQAWTGLGPNVLELAVPGDPAEIDHVITQLRIAFPSAKVEPVRQLVEAEANVLGKTRGALLGASLVIIVLATMCLLATLTASVLNRRKDFAVMRALGATRQTVRALFLAETATFALLGCVVGLALGIGVAIWIGEANFHAAVSPRWSLLPLVLVGTLGVAAAAAVLPMFLLERAQPATLLRGE